jgi:hypothetical protein
VTDDAWPMIEEAVFRLFDEVTAKYAGEHVAIGPQLAELGWSDIETEYPIKACEVLFRAQGRSLAHTDCLDRVMLAELAVLLDGPADAIVLPDASTGYAPGSDDGRVAGIVLGSPEGRLVVPVSGPMGTVSIGVVDASQMDEGQRAARHRPGRGVHRVEPCARHRASGPGDRVGGAGRRSAADRSGSRNRTGAIRRAGRIIPVAAACPR